jgi:hypothetical protein
MAGVTGNLSGLPWSFLELDNLNHAPSLPLIAALATAGAAGLTGVLIRRALIGRSSSAKEAPVAPGAKPLIGHLELLIRPGAHVSRERKQACRPAGLGFLWLTS